ncbi:MAG: hypothetical protein M0002_13280 [Rhodospirillales bacterium]|nr:hypothetical protein [Rhodospirillales bacterium]
MLNRNKPLRLTTLVASRMVPAALLVSVLLAGFFFVHYSLDTLYLRSKAIEDLSSRVATLFAEGKNTASASGVTAW